MIPKFNGNPLEKNAQKFVEHRRQYKIHKYRPNDLNFLDNASLPNSLPSSIIPPAFSLPFSLRLAPSLCLHDVSVFLSVYLSVAVSLSIFLCLSGCLSFFLFSLSHHFLSNRSSFTCLQLPLPILLPLSSSLIVPSLRCSISSTPPIGHPTLPDMDRLP